MSVPQMFTTVIVDFPPKPRQLYQIGWNAFCDGLPLNTLATADERRGWMAANRAQAEALTDGYAESMGW